MCHFQAVVLHAVFFLRCLRESVAGIWCWYSNVGRLVMVLFFSRYFFAAFKLFQAGEHGLTGVRAHRDYAAIFYISGWQKRLKAHLRAMQASKTVFCTCRFFQFLNKIFWRYSCICYESVYKPSGTAESCFVS